MANWKPPTAKSAGWSPRGLGWRRAGESISQFGTAFSAQLMAIKQYEDEKEAKRVAALEQRTKDWLDAFNKEKAAEQQRMIDEYAKQEERKYQEGVRKENYAQQVRLAWMKDKGKEKEPKDLITPEAQKHLDRLYKLETSAAQDIGGELENAWRMGDIEGMQKALRDAEANKDAMMTVTVGEKTTPTRDYFDLTVAARNLIRLAYEKSGQKMPAPTTQTRKSIGTGEWQAARAKIIEFELAGRTNDADYLLDQFDVPAEEVQAIRDEVAKAQQSPLQRGWNAFIERGRSGVNLR